MTSPTKDQIVAKLRTIVAPGGGDIVSRGMVSEIFVSDGRVMFSITVSADQAKALEPLRQAAEDLVKSVPGVERAMVALTAEVKGGPKAPAPAPRAAAPSPQQPATKPGIPGVKHIIAVASGKGGVGKSTTAVNLALALKANGLKIGILDADIYGPSLPKLLALHGRPETVNGKTLVPMDGYGLKAMSMGFLVEEETPMIWRGPMVMSALTQMLRDVAWGELDVLVVDMPPGTGDAQLTMAQQVPLSGAVIVSTPQDLALIDARRGVAMFNKVNVPVLGIVENMSYFICPDCGGRHNIFGHGGAKTEAARQGVPFLGEIPLDMNIRTTSDEGRPVVATEPDSIHTGVYRQVAAAVWERISGGQRAMPKIVFE